VKNKWSSDWTKAWF
jgi:hypothetical protein